MTDRQSLDRLVTRRQALALLGGVGAAAVAVACGGGGSAGSSASSASAATAPTGAASPTTSAGAVSCILTPEQTEGPYYLADEAIRSDITEGKDGLPLRLDLAVVDATSCQPLPGATVEVWHADADGNYSGFGAATSNTTFLRGGQVTDDQGKATFRTLYPGWYMGRTVHIHVKVWVSGSTVHTGQLYFDDAVSDLVFAQAPYDRGDADTTNATDNIYADGGPQSTLQLTQDGEGYVGAITMGVRTS